MSCKLDVRKAILDKIIEDHFLGRYTFSRIDDDSIQINGQIDNKKTKALSNDQARKIARNKIKEVTKKTNGHVIGSYTQNTDYEPVIIRFDVNPAFIDKIYNALPQERKTDPNDIYMQEGNQYFRGEEVYPTYEDASKEESDFYDGDMNEEDTEINSVDENLDSSEEELNLNNKFNELLEKGIITRICNG